jgi:hypothetical protein
MKQDLQAESYEQLLQRFLNAVRLIVSNRNVDDAERLITDIQKEWQRRRASGDAVRDYDRPEQGMLGALGYHVGHSQGQSTETRRLILKFVLEGELPMIHSANYTVEWGEPHSLTRLEKLGRVLENLIEGNRTRPNTN